MFTFPTAWLQDPFARYKHNILTDKKLHPKTRNRFLQNIHLITQIWADLFKPPKKLAKT